ncbi:MAG: carbohydrate binding family 9 domain-containing protein [Candidatus Aminicenantes bacterium]|jgi:hypothetical protein
MIKLNEFLPFLFILMFLLTAISVPGWGLDGDTMKLPHRVPAATSKVKIDGILNEKVWQEALVLELNYEVEPGENIKPPVKTEALLTYTSSHLYVAFRAYDPNPLEIRAHVTDRDSIWNDDYVGIVLDTFNDSRRTYNFYCNPYGVQADYIYTMFSMTGDENKWDAIWRSAGRINEEGYFVEMAIPFNSLRFQGKKGDQVWGIDVVRSYPRSLSHIIGFFPRDRSNNCYLCQAEKVIGFRGAKPGKNLEFDPTLSTIFTQEREGGIEGEFIDKKKKTEPGITARWGFTPNLMLSTTINPDFSNVEADVAQLDINTQFALYYPEKRPFFLEDSSIFKTRIQAIYTRSLADPNWGLKLTGKEGAHAIGSFLVRDNITNLLFPESQGTQSTSLNMSSLCSALRYRRDVGKSSNVGLVITDREGEDYFNRLVGIDGDIRFNKLDRVMFQFLGSQTRYPDQVAVDYNQSQDMLKGTAFELFYYHNTDTLDWFFDYEAISPNFRADVGFLTQAGFRYAGGGLRYTWRRNPGHWYTKITAIGQYENKKDYDKNLLYENIYCHLSYQGPLQSFIAVSLNIGKRFYRGVLFDENNLIFEVSLRPSGSLSMTIKGTLGDRIDYANIQAGDRIKLNPIIQYNLGRRLSLSFDHVFEKLNVKQGRLYTANLSNCRFVYQFNRRTFLRTIFQYAHYNYNSDLYSFTIDPKFKHLFTQILLSYKINPQTVLFLGYSDDYFGYQLIPLTQSNRTFFLKIGYALVL